MSSHASRPATLRVLVFAADPISAQQGGEARLLIDEEIRQIEEKVRGARYGRRFRVKLSLAVRTDDLVRAIADFRPHVVHFSGHGTSEGLLLVGKDGQPHAVDGEGLAALFGVFPGEIRAVVLNACFSLPHAEAITDSVDCAIGTQDAIKDVAAITFGSSFYRAVASGASIQHAFDQARAHLSLDRIDRNQHPRLVARPGVDPTQLILLKPEVVPPPAAGAVPPPPAPPEPVPQPSLPSRWPFPLFVWGVALLGSIFLVQNTWEAIGLSLVPVLLTIAMLYFARTETGEVRRRVKAAALALTVAIVAGGAYLLYSELEAAKEHYAAGNYAEALPRFDALAKEGNAEAMGYLGILYLSGERTAELDSLGIYWLSQAEAKGDARGAYALGIAYETGRGVRPDYRAAMRLYRSAQAKGNAEAMNKIGELYRQGLGMGLSPQYDSALVWYRRAAIAGSVDGMANLGWMLELGLADHRDMGQALHWYRKAADRGSSRAMVDLGWLYENGIGVHRDHRLAKRWYERAARAGDVYGMNNLAVLYALEHGVKQDLALACEWFARAASADFTEAGDNFDRLGCRQHTNGTGQSG